jgi:hypothetical protein
MPFASSWSGWTVHLVVPAEDRAFEPVMTEIYIWMQT